RPRGLRISWCDVSSGMSRGAFHLLFLHHLLLAFAARHAAQSGANSAAVSADWSRSARQTLQSIQLLWNPDEGNESEATENNTEVQLSQYLAVMALKSCTEMSSVNVKNSSVLELKRRLKDAKPRPATSRDGISMKPMKLLLDHVKHSATWGSVLSQLQAIRLPTSRWHTCEFRKACR
ncbi:unnamed protein product, partial [Durusdinium trenchii]